MKTVGMLSALCLCTMQLWGPFTAAAQVNPLQVRLGSHLLGSTVKNPQGKELGSIKDLVISPEDNRVIYAVLSFGGVLGLGEKAVAMPLSVLKPAAEAKTFVVEMDPERLRTAPRARETHDARLWACHRSTTLTSISRMSDTPTIGEKAVQLIRRGSADCLRTRRLSAPYTHKLHL